MDAEKDERCRPSTREQIPVVALKLFAERGYEATSMREIAEQLNMTKAALYYHFDSKEDIVRAILGESVAQVASLVEWAQSQAPSHALRLEVLCRWSDIMQVHGLAMFRFMLANGGAFHQARSHVPDMAEEIRKLHTILCPPDATVEDQLRIRLALMSINMAGLAGVGIEASEAEILTAARHIATTLLPAES